MSLPTQDVALRLDGLAHRGFALLVFFFASTIALVLTVSALDWQCDRSMSRALLVVALLLSGLLAHRMPSSRLEHRRDDRAVWWLAGLSLLAWVAQLVRASSLALARPVYDWDGLYYHVPAIHGWVSAGRVTWLSDAVDLPFANGYSMGTEVLGFIGFQVTGNSNLVDGSTLLLWPLGLLAIVVLCRQVGATPAWSWFVAGLTAQIPTFVALSTTTYVDAAFAIAAWAALAASVRWIGLQSRAGFVDAALLGAAIGLAATTKGLGWILGGLLIAFLLWSWFRARVSAPRTALQFLLMAVVIVSVAGYWPIRDVVHTGNPLHPLELRIGEKLLVEGYQPRKMVDQDLPPAWREWRPALRPLKSWFTFDGGRLGHNAVGGLGIVWLAFGLPSLIWLSLRRRSSSWPRWLGLFAVFMLVVQPADWWSRFTLWIHGLALPAAALAASILGGATRRRLCQLGAGLILVVGAIETDAALRWEAAQGRDPSTGDYMMSVDYYFPQFTEQDFAASLLVARVVARSPWGRMGTLLGGALSLPLGGREIVVLGPTLSAAEIATLREQGVAWIVWDVNHNGVLDEAVRSAAAESFRYQAEPAVDFEFLRL